MKKILETINGFVIEKDIMIIKCKKYNIVLKILNGTVHINIFNQKLMFKKIYLLIKW